MVSGAINILCPRGVSIRKSVMLLRLPGGQYAPEAGGQYAPVFQAATTLGDTYSVITQYRA